MVIKYTKKRNKFAQELYTKKYKSKIIKPKKGKGSFKRIKIKKKNIINLFFYIYVKTYYYSIFARFIFYEVNS